MEFLVGLGLLGLVGVGVWAWRRQVGHHQALAADIAAQLGEVRFLDPRALYYGLSSRGKLQPHELLAVLAVSDTVLRLEVPAVGVMSPISLTIPLDQVVALQRAKRFVALGPAARAGGAGLHIIHFTTAAGLTEELALRADDPEAFADVMEAGTGLAFSAAQ